MTALAHTDEVRLSSQDRLLAMIRAKRPDYHPVLAMVDLAHAVDHDDVENGGDRTLAFQCHKEVAKYVVAVDRMTEIKSEVVKTKRVIVEMFSGDAPKPLENNPSSRELPPVLAAGAVVDAEVKRTVVQERGPVEEPEEEEVVRQSRASVEVMGDPVASAIDDARDQLSMASRMG